MDVFITNKRVKGLNKYRKSIITAITIALLISIFVGDIQNVYAANPNEPTTVSGPASAEIEKLSAKIRQLVKELEYSEKVSEDFVEMVNRWQNRKANPFFAIRRQKLHQVRENYKQGRIKIADVAKAEESVAVEIGRLVKNKFSCSDEDFDLADVIKNKQANCLGYSQLFYILGNSISLSVIPINVVELQAPGPLPTGAAHVSYIVSLFDGRTIMLNLVPGGFVSERFIIEERFTKIGNYWELKDKDNPLDIYRKIQLLDKDGLIAYVYSNRGNVCASTGQYDRSIRDYIRAIKLNPNFAEAYNNRGIAYRNLGELKQAVADYTKAIELNPSYAEAYNNRGIAYRDLGLFDQAISDYNRAIKLRPDFAEAFNNRAVVYLHLGQLNQAISDCSKATKLDSNLVQAYYNRGIAYGLSSQFERAISNFNRAIKLSPNLARSYYSRANVYGKLAKFDRAIADYTKAIEFDSNFTKAYNNRAISYALLGKRRYAKKDLLKALESNPALKASVKRISDLFKLNLKLD